MPQFHELLAPLGVHWPVTPFNLSFLLALAAAFAVWLIIWRTRLGYEIRTVGANATAAVYGGISPARVTILTTLMSGALAGGMAVNVILGEEHRLILEYTAGFGFVGIAVALMGRAHPVGIILAAILFGVLYQGGAELAFEKPKISRDMIVVIQGLVVLFAARSSTCSAARSRSCSRAAPLLRRSEAEGRWTSSTRSSSSSLPA